MSVVIKGVNAPNNCYDCINSNDGEPFELLSNCPTFGDLCEGKITANELPKDKRSDSCPVKQLPTPHGRLIDCESDFFPTAFRHNLTDYAKGWNTCLRSVLLSPTIIEAEVSE